MSKRALNNIFEDRSTRTEYGTVSQRVSARRFVVLTDSGRSILADSDTDWGIGTQVIVQNKFIIGTGKRSGTFRQFSV